MNNMDNACACKEGGRTHGNLEPKVFETHTQIKL